MESEIDSKIKYASLLVSSIVPLPITLPAGNLEYFLTKYAITSTGFEAIKNIPLNPDLTIFKVISLIILLFLLTKSNLVSFLF